MKIAAVVILYYPDQHTVMNIRSYINQVDKLYVFDNSELVSPLQQVLMAEPKVAYFHDGENQGIAKRLNAAAQMATTDGFEWLLMMDQDSGFLPAMINQYLHCFHQYQHGSGVAMFGVNFEQGAQPEPAVCNPVFSDELITSGTLLNLSLYHLIGKFDEQLFIDFVDHEYTIRTLLKGYTIVQFPGIRLTHQLGIPVKRASVKTLFLVKKEKQLHSPLRCYYVYRNNLYLQQKYKNTQVVSMQKLNKIALSIIATTFYYGRNFRQLLHYLLLARKDFKHNRMGKCIEN